MNASLNFLRKVALTLSALVAVTLLTAWQAESAQAAELSTGAAMPGWDVVDVNADTPLCRYGAAAWEEDFLQELGIGWVVNFTVNFNQSVPEGVEYVPIVRLKQNRDPDTNARLDSYRVTPRMDDSARGLGTMVTNNPGRMWLIGNEVDRFQWQDDILPELYAEAYHDLYHFIKERDPSAQVAFAGLVQITPGRLQYITKAWDAYKAKYGVRMPVDVWNMHAYIFPEKKADGRFSNAGIAVGTDPALAILENESRDPALCSRDDIYCIAEHDNIDLFIKQIVDMRTWMKEHGEQNKPLIISEFSLLQPYEILPGGACNVVDENGRCFTPERVIEFMDKSFEYLEEGQFNKDLGYPHDEYRMVQQWLWFSAHDHQGGETNPSKLVTDDFTALTQQGQAFKRETSALNRYVDLVVEKVETPVVSSDDGGIELKVTIRNNGNVPVDRPFDITFSADSNGANVIGTVTVPAGLGGCAVEPYTATVTWDEVPDTTSVKRFYVSVDSANAVVESKEDDNQVAGAAFVNVQDIFLPLTNQ